MSQAPTEGMGLLDPFGFWKTARDSNLEAWSKFMIDLVNSDEYAQATGLALEQALATSQPVRDATEKTMTQTLSLLNMPSRAEVISLAERLVNVEMLLDDMDAKLSTMQKSLQETIKEAVREAIAAQDSKLKNLATQLEALDAKYDTIKKIETHMADLSTKLNALQVPAPVAVQPVAVQPVAVQPLVVQPVAMAKVEPKPEPKAQSKPQPKPEPKPQPKPQPKADVKPRHESSPSPVVLGATKEQEAK